MNEALRLVVHMDQATEEEVVDITRELCLWINEVAPSCHASPQQSEPGREGAKGMELGLLGSLTLVFLQSGALNDLVNCLATYVKERRRKVSLTVESPVGGRVTIDAENLGRREIEDLMRQMHDLAGPEPAAPGGQK